MIFQLRQPSGLLGLLVALVVGLFVHDAAQTLAARALGDATPWRQGRLLAGPAARLDVYGCVAAVIVGYGWGSTVPMDDRWRGRRRRVATAVAAGPAAYLALTVAAVALIVSAAPQPGSELTFLGVLTYTLGALTVLSLIPTPPLDGGRILFALAPQSLGWEKARYQLGERGFGVGVALLVTLLPVLIRVPSIVGGITTDLLDGLGSAFGQSHLGDILSTFDVV